MKKRTYQVAVGMLAAFCLVAGCGEKTEVAGATEMNKEVTETAAEETEEADEETETEAALGSTAGEEPLTPTTEEDGETPSGYVFREEPLVVELDAGHGKTGGAENEEHGVLERDVNLQIALKLKEELEAYENVTVYLTRDGAFDVELTDRVKKAVDDGADVLISLHNNAAGSICDYYNGCTVLAARGAGNPELAGITQELGCYILKELEKAGSENQGLMFRVTQDELYYDDGSLCDYYSIVRNSVKAGIPGIIVEHAFLDNEADYQAFFAVPDKIDSLAQADARGIAGYYHLKKKGSGEIPPVLKNHTEKITLIVSDDYQDNTYQERVYFTESRF